MTSSPGTPSLAGRRRPKERAIRVVLAMCGGLSVAVTAAILFTLVFETLDFFDHVSITEFFTGTRWSPLIAGVGGEHSYGVLPLVVGTMKIVVISALVGVPLGISTALYLSEYASRRLRNRLKPALEVLAGWPTVVLGYFALTFVTPVLVRALFPDADFYNALSAGIVVGILIVPIIASVSEDAISAVPRALREGAYGLGASKMAVALRVLLPAALSGIMAAIILGVSRAVGETMIVSIAAGSCPTLDPSPLVCSQTLTAYIVQIATGDAPRGSVEYLSIFAVGVLLFAMTLTLNIFSQRFVRRFRQVY